MRELSPEVQATLITWAGEVALASADKGARKKGKKNLNDRFADDFETTYKRLREIIDRVDGEPAEQ